jgi:protoporphyrinogen oxidase
MNCFSEDLTVLGGGASGISVGYYAKKNALRHKIYEATDRLGGNATTLQFKGFRFDTGAHRWHDRYPEITRELKKLIGDDLKKIHIPSHIFHHGKLIDFPLSPLNLLNNIGPLFVAKAASEVLIHRLLNTDADTDFGDFAVKTYGRSIAGRFLISYSEKLWGLPCGKLSSRIAGKRMNGLNLRTFILETLRGSKNKTEHLDGSFYYPVHGISDILEKWIDVCGQDSIHRRSRITGIFHNDKEILSIEINGTHKHMTKFVVTTLPITHFINLLSPSPPKEILEIGNSLVFRHIKLVALFIDRPSITRSATVYFPDKEFMFTRLYEPKNRSNYMSPATQTSLIMEIPCQYDSEFWEMKEGDLINRVILKLCEIGWIRKEEVVDALVHTMHNAYPVLTLDYEDKLAELFRYLKRFSNLAFTGRSSKFAYIHLHDSMQSGREIVDNYKIQFPRGFHFAN